MRKGITSAVLALVTVGILSTAATAGTASAVTNLGDAYWVGGTSTSIIDGTNYVLPAGWLNYFAPTQYPFIWDPAYPPAPSDTRYGCNLIIDDTAVSSQMGGGENWYGSASVLNFTDNRNSDYTIGSSSGYGNGLVLWDGATFNINTAHTLTVDSFSTTFDPGTGPQIAAITYNLVANSNLVIYASNLGNATLNGAGTITQYQGNNGGGTSLAFGGATLNVHEDNVYWVTGLTGSTGAFNMNGTLALVASGTFQQNSVAIQTSSQVFVASANNAYGQDGLSITGVNLLLKGSNGQLSIQGWGNGSPNNASGYGITQTWVNSTIAGDGVIAANVEYNVGPAGNLVSQGSTFAPQATNTPGSSFANGQLTMYGNLICGQNASAQNTTFKTAVTGTSGQLGTGYTKFSVVATGNWGFGSSVGTITSADSATTHNNLDMANLVVNITQGLSKGVHSVSDLGGGSDPFAGQTLAVVHADGTDLSSSSFAHVTFVGGSATVSYVANGSGGSDVVLSNIFSNPTLPGDINNDGLVDVADYNIWAANVGKTGATWLQGDLNGDGLVDVADYNIWAANVGKTAATPEPISMIILAIGGGFVALRRNRA
jgi:hypothetical protein